MPSSCRTCRRNTRIVASPPIFERMACCKWRVRDPESDLANCAAAEGQVEALAGQAAGKKQTIAVEASNDHGVACDTNRERVRFYQSGLFLIAALSRKSGSRLIDRCVIAEAHADRVICRALRGDLLVAREELGIVGRIDVADFVSHAL